MIVFLFIVSIDSFVLVLSHSLSTPKLQGLGTPAGTTSSLLLLKMPPSSSMKQFHAEQEAAHT